MKKLLIALSLVVWPILAFIQAHFAKKRGMYETSLRPIGAAGCLLLLVAADMMRVASTGTLSREGMVVCIAGAAAALMLYFVLMTLFLHAAARLKTRSGQEKFI